jgi:hypothetical protein
MFKHTTYAAAMALAFGAAASLSAQQTAATPQTSGSTTSTIVGCVYEEKDVPGRAPNIVERAGVLEDYILAELSPAEASRPVGTSGSSTPTTYSMYKLEHAKDSELKAMVGKRVEVMGKIDAEAGDATGQPSAGTQTSRADDVIGRDKVDLPEFEVVSMKEVPGSCPAKPSSAR